MPAGDDQVPGQRNARKADQVRQAERLQRQRAARRRQLWRNLMAGQLTAAEGREFVNDVLFGDIGLFRPIDLHDTPAMVAERVARHNIGVRWLRDDVAPHRELYRQLQAEAQKRGEELEREQQATATAQTTDDE